MFQASGRLNYGLKPVPGADWSAFDPRRLRDYFTRVLQGDAPQDIDRAGWERLLTNVDLMTESAAQRTATIDGLLLFGSRPQRFLAQSGIRAICYTAANRDYATRADEDIRGPMVFLGSASGELTETGLVERALDFVRRNTETTAVLDRGRRIDRREYPEAVIRELVVNALVHRDYSIPGMRAHNGTAPELIAEEHRFIVRLLKAPKEKS